jgi:hypothetical protein
MVLVQSPEVYIDNDDIAGFFSVNNYSLGSIRQEVLYPCIGFSTDSVVIKLMNKETITDFIKCFLVVTSSMNSIS